ncbi:TonB-dependent receptor [Limibacter armeniacum]|uniref:SusC/RagA family TonB-linked outer membrane protein n=1 Tax=Limibacter armeniacum TaxID=466084 RepID=UPI002FE5ABCC
MEHARPLKQRLQIPFINRRSLLLIGSILILFSGSAWAQITVKGTVKDENSEPIPGASITVKDKPTGTITDFDGLYTITNLKSDDVLLFSFVGYQSQEIKVGTQSVINVQLEPDMMELSEVVVVGYGTQEKVNVTGSVSQVDSEVMSGVPTPDAVGALQGRIAGVQITSQNSQPGSMPSIRVRGVTTLGSNNAPLVVIDGVPSSYENFGMLSNGDIESVSVLKDAASASIYGARAAAGVILVTTKKGSGGKTRVSYEGYVGVQTMTRRPEYMDSYTWALKVNEAAPLDGQPVYFTDDMLQQIKDGSTPYRFANTDWINEVYEATAVQQSHYLNVSGGNHKTRYFASIGYLDQDGFFTGNDNYKRYNAKLNMSSDLSKYFKVNAQMNYTRQERNRSADWWRVTQAMNMPNIVPAYYEDGSYGVHKPWDGGFVENPLLYMNTGDLKGLTNTLQSFLSVDFKPFKGMTITGRTSMNYRNYEQNAFYANQDFIRYDGQVMSNSLIARAEELWSNDLRMVNDLVANYQIELGSHNLGAMVGIAEEFFRYDEISARRTGFANNELNELAPGNQSGQIGTSTAYDWALHSYFGRFNYSYSSKYLMEVNLRVDNSSRFAPENRRALFPSASLGWRVTEEPFFADNVSTKTISDLKLRLSVGTLGNQNVTGYYPYIPLIGSADYPFNNEMTIGKAQNSMTVEDITWETTTTYNLGADIDFLDGKLGASFDLFKKVTDDILLQLPVSSTAGLDNPFINAGQLENNGWEIDLRYSDETQGGFKYSIGGNVARFENKITNLAGAYSDYSQAFREGDPIGSIYGYRSLGIYRDQAQVDLDNRALNGEQDAIASGGVGQTREVQLGDLRFEDVNGDGMIDYQDIVNIGNTLPKITYGVNFDASYKNWDFSMFWQGAADIDGYVGKSIYPTSINSNFRDFMEDSYNYENNPDGEYPRISINENTQSGQISDFWVQSASYLRLKNLQIGYNLPEEALSKLGMSKCRIYVSGQNLLTFTGFDEGFDPEMVAPMNDDGSFGGNSSDYRAQFYPTVAVYSGGVQITF